MTLCTICYNYEHTDSLHRRYEPSLEMGDRCGRCGQTALDERVRMECVEDSNGIVECFYCEAELWRDGALEHHAREHPEKPVYPNWYYDRGE